MTTWCPESGLWKISVTYILADVDTGIWNCSRGISWSHADLYERPWTAYIYISCFYCFIANFYFTAGWELKCWLPFIFFLPKSKSSAAGHGHAHLHVVNQTSKTTAGVCEVSNEDAAGHDELSVCPTVAFAQGLSVCQGAEWQGRQSSCGWYQACGSRGEAAALSWEWVLQGRVMLTSEARVSQMLWKVSQVCWSSSLSL